MEYNRNVTRKTLLYSAIFHYPLTKEELWRYAIATKPLTKENFFISLDHDNLVASEQGYYYYKQNNDLVTNRLRHRTFSVPKMILAKKTARLLSGIPSVLFIGLTGSLAMENAKENDDIDLCIITCNRALWLTRLSVLICLQLLGNRRKKFATRVTNAICVNLFMEVSHMQLPRSSQNLYTAHEVAQVKPLFDRENTYQTFMMTNHWVTAYLPNAFEHLYPLAAIDKRKKSRFVTAFRYVVTFFNVLARYVQLWYMTDKANSEIISDTVLAFYTGTTQKKVLAEYEKRLQDEGL